MRVRRPAGHNQLVATDVLIPCAGDRDNLNRVCRAKAPIASAIRWVFPYIDS
jgi:hypothetical protein